jgi:hypothetical protein
MQARGLFGPVPIFRWHMGRLLIIFYEQLLKQKRGTEVTR